MNQKALCSLAAAAEALGDSIHRLLESTTYGSLRLYVKVPQDVLLFSIDEEQASPPRHTSTFSNPPFPPKLLDSKMTFLEISKKDRVNLFNNGFTQQTIFTFAIKVLPDSSISRERAPGSTSPSRYPVMPYKVDVGGLARRFATYSKRDYRQLEASGNWDMAHVLDITAEDVYVLRSELSKLIQDRKLKYADFASDVPLTVEPHTSKKLVALHTVLLEVWWLSSDQNEPVPGPESISATLIAKHKFSKNHAKHAAAMILRASVTKRLPQRPQLVAKEIAAVIDCSSHWHNFDSNDPRTYPANKEIMNELVSRHDFPTYLAEAATGIIRPEHASKGGRRKDMA